MQTVGAAGVNGTFTHRHVNMYNRVLGKHLLFPITISELKGESSAVCMGKKIIVVSCSLLQRVVAVS